MKENKDELQPRNFIKEIKIDEHQHLLWLAVLLILSNILLLFAVIYLVVKFMRWYIWILDICILVYCIVQSVRTYKNSSKMRVYSLYDNCLVVKSLLYDTVIDLSQVFEVKPKRTLCDRLAKNGKMSVEILIKSKSRDKIILRHINEDITELCQQILDLANKCREEKREILLDSTSSNSFDEKEQNVLDNDAKLASNKNEANIDFEKDENKTVLNDNSKSKSSTKDDENKH